MVFSYGLPEVSNSPRFWVKAGFKELRIPKEKVKRILKSNLEYETFGAISLNMPSQQDAPQIFQDLKLSLFSYSI